ncbi:MAG: hypothetical protein LBJ67_08775 [Planctomycetaceae bacterium]|jgi:hypothetical protein|nr:hypothetical protein [Planctomycetaceae bacterium]
MITCAVWFAQRLWQTLGKVHQETNSGNLSQRSGVFLNRQFRRRIQVAVMIGLSGFFMAVGACIPTKNHPKVFILLWGLAILLLLWSIVIAVIDAISVSVHYSRIHHQQIAEQIRVQYELEKKRQEQRDAHNQNESPKPENDKNNEHF